MVQSICDCSAVQSSVCLSECLAAAPVFLLRSNPPVCFVVMCKTCGEIVVHRMFAVFLNGLNVKNSLKSILQNMFFGLFVLF